MVESFPAFYVSVISATCSRVRTSRSYGTNISCSGARNDRNLCFCRIGVVSGKAIFGPPLDEYWKKKLREEAAGKESNASSPSNS